MAANSEVTRLTARGRGAVAVLGVRISDAQTASPLDQHFSALNGISPSAAAVGRILYGHWGHEDVVVVRTDQHEWEIHCHGGEAAVSRITSDLAGDSVESVATQQSVSSSLDAALMSLLLKCRTRQTAEILLAQMQGVQSGFLRHVASMDSHEEVVPLVQSFLQWQQFSEHLTEPWQIAVVGRPNAGKSSLLNAILGFERSIVFDQPGTTRDRVESEVIIGGWPFLFLDTAGIREATNDIEFSGIETARSSITECDVCLLIVDATIGWTSADAELLDLLPASTPVAIVLNKTDLQQNTDPPQTVPHHRPVAVRHTSATTGAGMDQLIDWIPGAVISECPQISEPLPLVPEILQIMSRFLTHKDCRRLQHDLSPWIS